MEIIKDNLHTNKKNYRCKCRVCGSKFKLGMRDVKAAGYSDTVSGLRRMFYQIECPCCNIEYGYVLSSHLFGLIKYFE